jgi:acyl-CoA dehydrogenase
MIKIIAPNVTLRVLDRAIQAHGAAGVCQDTFLASAWANSRTLRLADGPDEVHREAIAKMELERVVGKARASAPAK